MTTTHFGWTYKKAYTNDGWHILLETPSGLKRMDEGGRFRDEEDARLMAAAPLLLAALERMLAAHDADVEMGSLVAAGNGCAAEEAREAIKAAKT